MWPLLICSVVALAVIMERAFFWVREATRRNPRLVDEVLSLAEREQYEEIRQRVQGNRDYVVRVLISGILHRAFSLTSAMEIAAEDELRRMRRGLIVLDTLVTLSPMLGILGTVTGIIKAFDLLGTSGFQDPRVVTVGVAEALITTAAGLVIALPCLVAYNYFQRKAETAAGEMETYGTSLEIVHKRNSSRRVDDASFRVEPPGEGERLP
jgi:biopolymer transport protein ExbB